MTVDTEQLVVFTLIGLPVLLGYLGRRRKLRFGHLLAIAAFWAYLLGVAHFTLLPVRYDPLLAAQVGPWTPQVGLVPFFLPGGDGMPAGQIAGNILLGVPFGFGLPFVRRISTTAVVAWGVVFSLAIESAQLGLNLTRLALPTRSVDLNDVILNTTGVVCGVLAYIVARTIYRGLFGRFSITAGPWSHYHRTLMAGVDQRVDATVPPA